MGRTLLWTINVADSKNTRRAIKHERGGDGRPRFNLMLALGFHAHYLLYAGLCFNRNCREVEKVTPNSNCI